MNKIIAALLPVFVLMACAAPAASAEVPRMKVHLTRVPIEDAIGALIKAMASAGYTLDVNEPGKAVFVKPLRLDRSLVCHRQPATQVTYEWEPNGRGFDLWVGVYALSDQAVIPLTNKPEAEIFRRILHRLERPQGRTVKNFTP